MSKRNYVNRSLELTFVLTVLGVGAASAQKSGPLDVRSCFSEILVDTTIDKRNTNVRYAIQEQWSKDLFEEAKRSNTLTAWIDGVTVQDSYEAANSKRLHEMYSMAANYNFSSNAALYHASLDPQAKDIITHCLDGLAARRGIGLYWVPWVHSEDPTLVSLELRFQYHPTQTPLHVQTKRIDGAVVEDDDKKHPTKLFDWSVANLHPFDYDVLMPYESRFVTLRRQNPSDTITVEVVTNPNLSVPPITIEGEPKPQTCEPHAFNMNEFNQPLHVEVTDLLIDRDDYLMRDPRGNPIPEGNGAAFRIAIPLQSQYPDGTDFTNAQITNVVCQRIGSPMDFMDWTYAPSCCLVSVTGKAEGLTGVCRGWWQNRGRHIKMSIDWQRLGYQCTSHDWQKGKDGKWH
jgi:hypothetical protein